MSLELCCLAGEVVPARCPLDGPLSIGRDPHCDLRLLDERSSRHHARIDGAEGRWELHDLDSANGVLVDGARVASLVLAPGVQFAIGSCRFAVLDAALAAADTRVPTDSGAELPCVASAPARPWQQGDDDAELQALHATLRLLGPARAAERPQLLARIAATALACSQAAVVLGDRVVCDPQVVMGEGAARRLAGGSEARLLVLGHDLHGATIARAAIGSALVAPLGRAGHLVLARGLDEEACGTAELSLLAHLAAEAATWFPAAAGDDELVGSSAAMQDLRARIARIARADATVLITGASGTGKELVARALHRRSGRNTGPLVAINCAALPEQLAESELFGHRRGAFTGADRDRPGRFREAHGGMLFLDEIGELPLPLQAKLLRVLQDGVVEPVGGGPQLVDVRILAATNRDLQAEVQAGRFRADLLFRLDVVRIATPTLDERRGDIPLLVRHLLRRAAAENGVALPADDGAFIAACCERDWPGNIRQLGNACTRALVLVEAGRLDPRLLDPAPVTPDSGDDAPFPSLAELEGRHVAAALSRTAWNKSAAARLLGISRPTLLRKIAEHGLLAP